MLCYKWGTWCFKMIKQLAQNMHQGVVDPGLRPSKVILRACADFLAAELTDWPCTKCPPRLGLASIELHPMWHSREHPRGTQHFKHGVCTPVLLGEWAQPRGADSLLEVMFLGCKYPVCVLPWYLWFCFIYVVTCLSGLGEMRKAGVELLMIFHLPDHRTKGSRHAESILENWGSCLRSSSLCCVFCFQIC